MARNPPTNLKRNARARAAKKWRAEKQKNLNLRKATNMFGESSSTINDNGSMENPKKNPNELCEIETTCDNTSVDVADDCVKILLQRKTTKDESSSTANDNGPTENPKENPDEASEIEMTYDNTSVDVDVADDCVKILLQRNPNWCSKKYEANTSISKRLPLEKGVMSLEDYESINNYALSIEKCKKDPSPLEGYRIVDLGYVLEWSVSLQYEHSKVCTQGKLKIKEERRRELGLVSQIVFQCDMCDAIFRYSTEDPKKSILNIAAVWGTLATGSSFSHFDELLSTMNIPSMPENMFYKIENELGNEWNAALWRSMEAAGKKEREHAITCGNLTSDGIPWITVYLDGSWSKRSYGSNYNALSGMIGIIGQHTGEHVFVSVRNKYCSICAFDGDNYKSHILLLPKK